MTVAKKIGGGYWLASIILIGLGFLSYRSTTTLVANNRAAAHTELVLADLESLISLLKDAETGQRGFLLTGKESYLEPYATALSKIDTTFDDLRRLTNDNPNQQRRLDELKLVVRDKLKELDQTISLMKAQGFDAALKVVNNDSGKYMMDEIRSLVLKMRKEESELLQRRTAEVEASAQTTVYTIGIGTLAAIIFTQVAGVLIARSIVNPLSKVVEIAQKIAEGNLTAEKLTYAGKDELGHLAAVFNQMLDGLKDLATQTVSVTGNINNAAAEIMASTQQQAASTKEQATAIQQITSTMAETSRSGSEIIDRAKQVATAAEAASATSKSGIQAVQNTNATMQAIREQVEEVAENIVALSEKAQAVGEIIATVNEIAEQSNLLALNATIEAVSAGSEGSRFSVVANEMKNLADQAKECTVQVRAILGEIQKGINTSVMLTEEAVKRVESGKKQTDVSEQTIHSVSETTESSIQAFQQIIGAANQQQIGFEQVTQGMQSIRQAAEQTAASTSQHEKAVANLTALSQQLRRAVSNYKLN
ncbi:MAG TPA: CHASE3 domain-containing protein [Pirellulales bacterium]|jgi:methyl-accepting chemotaxis protein|nr:CHASE3 domain-containing protein [Pirellulales bacterium]